MSDIDPLLALIVIHYVSIYKSTCMRHDKLCLTPVHRISVIVKQEKHYLTIVYNVGHYIHRHDGIATVPKEAPFKV